MWLRSHGATYVSHLDGAAVGDGHPGPVFRAVAELVHADSLNGEEHTRLAMQ